MTVSANELRVGNWIYDTDLNENVQVGSINTDCIGNPKVNNNDLWFYNPIEITTEILEACGFEKNVYNNIYSIDGFDVGCKDGMFQRLIYNEESTTYTSSDWDYFEPFDTPFRFLHELQNKFYFATGKEIEIKQLTTVQTQTA